MPTIAGLRRRGFPPEAIRDFISRIAITKTGDSTVEMAMLEFCVRNLLNKQAERRMAVLDPIKVVIENYPEGETEYLDAVNNPEDEAAGIRQVPFSRELYIERADFMVDPPKKFFRLGPGREVRLRWAYFITCQDYVTDADGNVTELRCTYDPATKGGDAPDGRKVKGTLHWVSASHAVPADVRMYEYLFSRPDPGAEGDWLDDINPESLQVIEGAMLEPSILEMTGEAALQFERQGYFVKDADSTADKPVFNRTIGLRDSWAKEQKRR
jgi:glutaminyl-tRNA synthetase